MASPTSDSASARRTFANVAASASIPTQNLGPISTNSNNDESESGNRTINGTQAHISHIPETIRINPAIPKKLAHLALKSPEMPGADALVGPKLLVQSPGASVEGNQSLSGHLPSVTSDENTTQLSSSDSSAKPASLDGKSVASATTFAMDEKESLRPDDSASVKAIEDEDLYSPPDSAAIGSRVGSENGARAFRDQLQEITSMGPPSRPSLTASRSDARFTPNEALLYNPSAIPTPGQLPGFPQTSENVLGKPADFPPDQKLLEAISNPRDRIWVLKLEQDIIDFVKDSKEPHVDLPQCNSFYRMLAHKLADYYLLGHVVDNTVTAVRLYRTPTCRIAPPLTALTNPSTASNTPPPAAPQVQILRRSGEAPMAKSASETGDSDSDKNKGPLTREEREQRYEQARLRIMGSAKPEADAQVPNTKDESRSSSAAGKKKPKKQRTNSEDGFDPRSAYSTYPPGSSYSQTGTPENGGNAAYYPAYTENGGGMYGAPTAYTPQTFNAVYGGQAAPSQPSYPWLQQGYSGYADANGSHWEHAQQNGNDLAAEFQQMSFQSPSLHGQTGSSSQNGPFGYQNQQQAPWTNGMPYQPNYSMPAGYPQYASSERPVSSASHPSQYGYGTPANQMQGQFMGPGYPGMNGAFQRPSFNPQSQAFIPNYQGRGGHQSFMPAMGQNASGYSSFAPQQTLQRQNSTHSQASSYNGQQRAGNDGSNTRGPTTSLTHPLPQPVFSPNVPMPYQNQKQQQQQQQQSTPSRSTSGNGPSERSPGSNSGPSASTIAKWGTPASLPAKPPPPANDSFDIGRIQGQRAQGFNPAATARLPGMGAPGYHALPSMVRMPGAAPGPSSRGGQ